MTGTKPIAGGRQGQALRIVVAMSGGVDSSVAAAILKNEGHQVIGVTMKLQDCREARGSRSCCGVDGIIRARAVAGQLGIPHYVVDCVREFEHEVLRPAWDEYANGRTPSPCLLCNERVKFGVLLSWSQSVGASCVATGHYAKVEFSPGGEPILLRGVDPEKDQSYFLSGLDKKRLSSVVFPVGHLKKAAVRAMGRSMRLSTAETHDSQDACLVDPGQSFAEMLRQRFSGMGKAGVIVDEAGQVLGQHSGIHHFTIGQRRGLAVPSTSRRWVKTVHVEDGTVIVTDKESGLLSQRLVATGMSWIAEPPGHATLECEVQVRYRHAAEAATISYCDGDTVTVAFRKPVRAITPGQAAVFYDGSRVLGRGWIRAC